MAKWWVVNVPSGLPRDPGQEALTVREEPLPVDAQKVAGPFDTEAEARKKLNQLTHGNPSLPSQVHEAQGPVHVSNPLDFVQEIGHWIGVLVTDITDVAMWRSIGWIMLGAAMFIGGVFLWLKDKGVLPDVVPIPV